MCASFTLIGRRLDEEEEPKPAVLLSSLPYHYSMVKQNLLANYLGSAWTAVMGVAFIPLYIEYLGVEAYGLIGFFAVLQISLSIFDLGIRTTLNREFARYSAGSYGLVEILNLLRSLEVIAALIAGLLFLGIWFAADWLSNEWLGVESISVEVAAQAISIMGVVVGIRMIEGVYSNCLLGLQRQLIYNAIIAGSATLRGLGVVGVLHWLEPSVQAYFVWQGLVSALTVLILGVATYGEFFGNWRQGRFSSDALRKVWRFSGAMAGVAAVSALSTQIDKLVVSKYVTLEHFGYYTFAFLVGSMILILVVPVVQALYPRMSQLHAESSLELLSDLFHRGAQMVTVTIGAVGVAVILFAEELLNLWVRDAQLVDQTASLVSIICVGTLLNTFVRLPYTTLNAHGFTAVAFWSILIVVISSAIALVLVVPEFGLTGAAWVWVAINSAYFLVGTHFVFRKVLLGQKIKWFLEDVFQPLLAVIAALLPVYFFVPFPASSLGTAIILMSSLLWAILLAGFVCPSLRRSVFTLVASGYARM